MDGAGLIVMPGTLARTYRSQGGGPVVLMGKPAPVIYEAATRMLGLSPEKVVAIGDSLEHDVGGYVPQLAHCAQQWPLYLEACQRNQVMSLLHMCF